MVVDIRPLRDDMTNVDWINAVRNEAGYDYQRRVPEATQANVQDVVQQLFTYRPHMNEFIDTLVNRIGLVLFANTIWSNPLSQFKRGMLEWGDTIEEIMNGLLTATSYDPDRDELEKEIFGAMKPETQVSYHRVDRRDRYKLTIKEPLLRNAFLTSNGLSQFITNLMSSAQTSDQWDEYLLMVHLFEEFDKAEGFFNVNVPDIADQASDAPDSRYVLRRLREFSNTLPFISRMYNPAGMPVATTPSELILFVTATADAAMDVEALAAAFNIGKAEFGSRKIILPTDHFGIPGVQAILTTKNFFVVADQRIETTAAQNPAALFTNYWLHHWQVISGSRFAPLIMFNSERPSTVINYPETLVVSVSTLTVKDDKGATQATNVLRGELYSIEASAVTNPAGGVNDAVRYELVGALSQFTRINNNGVLYVGPDETANTLTINAMAVDSEMPQPVATTSRGVSGTLVGVWPNPDVNEDADLDTIEEAVPETLVVNEDDNVIIPNVRGVQYLKAGSNVTNNSVHHITASTVFTAVARSGFELKPGATATWTLVP